MNPEFLINSKLSSEQIIDTYSEQTQRVSRPKINRVLRWFEKEGDNLVGEKVISNINLEHLQKLFGIDSENPMYDCYSVESAEQINYLQNSLNLELDTRSYDYLVECDMVEPTSTISIKYRICLLINLEGDPNRGGYLIVDELNENPELVKGDRFDIKNWKVGYSNSQGIGNLSFDFEAQVISIKKTLIRHEELLMEIYIESLDREKIKKLVDALRERNPDLIKSSTNN